MSSSPDKTKRALIVVDMANDFLLKSYNPGLALEGAMELVPRIRKLEEAFLESKLPVIYSTDRHVETDYELRKWGPHSMKGTQGSQIVDGLIKEDVFVFERGWKREDLRKVSKDHLLYEVEKGTYSGFTDNGGKPTAVDSLLKKLGFKAGRGDKLYISGLHTNCCDKHTAADAWFRGFIPVIVSDCTASFDDPDGKIGMGHDRALNYERFWYDAEVKNSDEVLKDLGTAPTAVIST